MFGKVMSVPDVLLESYLTLTTSVPTEDIARLLAGHPKEAKEALGRALVGRYHGEAAAAAAAERFRRVFSEKRAPEEMPDVSVASGTVNIIDLVMTAKFAKSRSEARRLIEQGGVTIDGKKIEEIATPVTVNGGEVLRVGKLQFARLRRSS
jgi:tyrosyl-tRNA synthetase